MKVSSCLSCAQYLLPTDFYGLNRSALSHHARN